MKQAEPLKKGDRVRILSTARKISREEVKPAIALFKSWGLSVSLGKHLFHSDHQFAGTEAERTADLQEALDDPELKAIFFARGGYGSVQLVDRINYSGLIRHPKWLVGYSDITVFHCHLNRQLKLESIHAPMPVNIKEDHSGLSKRAIEELKNILFGRLPAYRWHKDDLNLGRWSEIKGELVGGNLSILYSLSGSNSQLNGRGKIIFMEDLDEYLYHIDRMMMNLIRAGLFDGCRAVLVGGMSDMNDNETPYGSSAKEIIAHRLKSLNLPLIFDFPAGHIHDNCPLIMGRKTSLINRQEEIELQFHERTQ